MMPREAKPVTIFMSPTLKTRSCSAIKGGISAISIAAAPMAALSDETPDPHTPQLQVQRLQGSLYALGEIHFDSATRTIRFPATVNMTEGAVEFALVGTQGKLHESVLATDIRPLQLRTVLSLLDFEPSPAPAEPSPAPVEPSPAPVEGETDEDPVAAPALVDIAVSWNDPTKPKGHGRKRVSLRQCILVMEFEPISEFGEKVHLNPLPEGPWTYTGSRVDGLGFEAERELDFIAVQHRPSALFNLPHPNADRDDLWQANEKALPAKDTPVTVEIMLPQKPEK